MKRFVWIPLVLVVLPVLSIARGTNTGTAGGEVGVSGQSEVKDHAPGESSGGTADAKLACTVPTTCLGIEQAINSEYARIASCSADADCGQVLNQTSCGCTREWVARTGADSSCFYALKKALYEMYCNSEIFASSCGCHPASGFTCHNEQCSWEYTM